MKPLIKAAKFIIPLGLAAYLMYITFRDPQDRAELAEAISQADFLWVGVSMIMAWCSHAIRARRWKYLLEPLGYRTRFWTAYHAVWSGYLINTAIPRAGEVSRAGLFSGAEKIPFDKTFGSIAAERIVDLVMLGLITGLTIITQYDLIWNAMQDMIASRPEATGMPLYQKAGIGLIVLLIGLFVAKRLGLFDKIRGFVSGIIEGLLSIVRTPYKWQFLRDTLLIWGLYLGMFTVLFQCLEATQDLGLGAVLAGFVFGSFALVLTPGGTGAYHIAVAFALSFYGIENSTGQAMGLIMWGSQTALVIVLGLLSLLLLPIYNRDYAGHTAIPTA